MIDPRGPRFVAWISAAVLVLTLLLSGSPTTAGLLLSAQAVVFALGSRGLSPYQLVFRRFVRPRLSPPEELEAEAPTRFAQVVGLAFAATGAASFLAGATTAGLVLTGFALVAALLNAATGLCLGCELYLIIQRLKPTRGVTA
ncbi:MAG: hypothetical protein JWN31_544 [Frankiales bacterium]|nr:hypothetical protein [Frankiales bacterium]